METPPLQILTSSWDKDTGILELRLADGADYRVTNAGHAAAIRQSIGPGGCLSLIQRDWLERYRVKREVINRGHLVVRLRAVRQELTALKGG